MASNGTSSSGSTGNDSETATKTVFKELQAVRSALQRGSIAELQDAAKAFALLVGFYLLKKNDDGSVQSYEVDEETFTASTKAFKRK